jgi:uncharacterized membrane protein YkoI
VTDRLKKLLLGMAALAALALGGSALAGATSGGKATDKTASSAPSESTGPEQGEGTGDESDTPLTGDAARRAKEAALAKTGGGAVGDVEADTEHGATYAVEVTTADGSTVDVRLDGQFKVLGVEPANAGEQHGQQDEGAGETGETDDDGPSAAR